MAMRSAGTVREVGFGPYTVRDLDALPDGGKGFELEDGWLIELSPSPWHNWAAQKLARIVEDTAARAGAQVFVGTGGEWEISTPAGIRKPDAFMVPRNVARAAVEDRMPKQIPGRDLLFVAEVVSRGSGSERTDRVRKVREYAALAIAHYWIVELDPRPRVRALTLDDGAYHTVGVAEAGSELSAELTAEPDVGKPFTVVFDPAVLAVLS